MRHIGNTTHLNPDERHGLKVKNITYQPKIQQKIFF